MTSQIDTPSGKFIAIRVDNSFLCECGCGRRVSGNKRFFSHACYGQFRRNKKDQLTNQKTPTCQWCKRIISQGERYCSDKCKKSDYERKGWKDQSLSDNAYTNNNIQEGGGEKAI